MTLSKIFTRPDWRSNPFLEVRMEAKGPNPKLSIEIFWRPDIRTLAFRRPHWQPWQSGVKQDFSIISELWHQDFNISMSSQTGTAGLPLQCACAVKVNSDRLWLKTTKTNKKSLQMQKMKRRNAEVGKLRRPVKRNKIADGFYGRCVHVHCKIKRLCVTNWHDRNEYVEWQTNKLCGVYKNPSLCCCVRVFRVSNSGLVARFTFVLVNGVRTVFVIAQGKRLIGTHKCMIPLNMSLSPLAVSFGDHRVPIHRNWEMKMTSEYLCIFLSTSRLWCDKLYIA